MVTGRTAAFGDRIEKQPSKALERERNYNVEFECHQRFKEQQVSKILGFSIPQLIGANDSLLVIEMRIVTPPFILDFAKAWLDQPADFSDEGWRQWEEEGRERFDEKWGDVLALLSVLKNYGIYYYDAKPANIMFAG